MLNFNKVLLEWFVRHEPRRLLEWFVRHEPRRIGMVREARTMAWHEPWPRTMAIKCKKAVPHLRDC